MSSTPEPTRKTSPPSQPAPRQERSYWTAQIYALLITAAFVAILVFSCNWLVFSR